MKLISRLQLIVASVCPVQRLYGEQKLCCTAVTGSAVVVYSS